MNPDVTLASRAALGQSERRRVAPEARLLTAARTALGGRRNSRLPKEVTNALKGIPGTVMLLAGDASVETLAEWQRVAADRLCVLVSAGWPGDKADNVVLVTSRAEIADQLVKYSPVAMIVEENAPPTKSQIERWQEFFLYVRKGGHYLIRRQPDQGIWDLALGALKAGRKGGSELEELAQSSGPTVVVGDYIMVQKSQQHAFKLREDQLDQLPLATSERLRVEAPFTSEEGGAFRSSMQVHKHPVDSRVTLPSTEFHYPALAARHYRGPIHLGSHLLTYVDNVILPPSFPHPFIANPGSQIIRSINQRIARQPEPINETSIAGPLFDLNCAIPGHFGHVMTESLSKLWAWDAAKEAFPSIKGIYRLPEGRTSPAFERQLFQAFGIPASDVIWATNDVTCSSYVSATPAWQNGHPRWFHPVIESVWARLRSSLVSSSKSSPHRLFVSRAPEAANRACRNLPDVEEFFRRRGFTVVLPELLSIPEQATLFANARVIAGIAGSAMFNMLYTQHVEKVVVLTHESYTARNEWLYSAMLAEELHYFFSVPETSHPEKGFSTAAFHSAWTFDFGRDGGALDAALHD